MIVDVVVAVRRVPAARHVGHRELDVIVAGRDGGTAEAFCKSLEPRGARALRVDVLNPGGVEKVLACRPAVVVDTVGPFQDRADRLALACAMAGAHYVDIADNRARVAAISELDAEARARGVIVLSGASTVPAITTAIVDALVPSPQDILEIEVGISPGHRAPRGIATVRSILGYGGRLIPDLGGRVAFGWGDLSRHRYPSPVGNRWLSNIDTPERALWPVRYPSLQRLIVRAGLELSVLHLGLSALSRGVRAGLVEELASRSETALRIANWLRGCGSDSGAMHVRVVARNSDGQRHEFLATLVAENGDGPQIPATPAALIVKKLLGLPGYDRLEERGAHACLGFVTLDELLQELSPFNVRIIREPGSADESHGGR